MSNPSSTSLYNPPSLFSSSGPTEAAEEEYGSPSEADLYAAAPGEEGAASGERPTDPDPDSNSSPCPFLRRYACRSVTVAPPPRLSPAPQQAEGWGFGYQPSRGLDYDDAYDPPMYDPTLFDPPPLSPPPGAEESGSSTGGMSHMVLILAGSCLVVISAALMLVVAVVAARKCLRRIQQQHSPHSLGAPSGQPPWLEAIRAYRAVRAPRPGSAATQTFPGSQYGVRGRPTSGSALDRLYLYNRDALASPAGGGSSLFDANPDGKHVVIQLPDNNVALGTAMTVDGDSTELSQPVPKHQTTEVSESADAFEAASPRSSATDAAHGSTGPSRHVTVALTRAEPLPTIQQRPRRTTTVAIYPMVGVRVIYLPAPGVTPTESTGSASPGEGVPEYVLPVPDHTRWGDERLGAGSLADGDNGTFPRTFQHACQQNSFREAEGVHMHGGEAHCDTTPAIGGDSEHRGAEEGTEAAESTDDDIASTTGDVSGVTAHRNRDVSKWFPDAAEYSSTVSVGCDMQLTPQGSEAPRGCDSSTGAGCSKGRDSLELSLSSLRADSVSGAAVRATDVQRGTSYESTCRSTGSAQRGHGSCTKGGGGGHCGDEASCHDTAACCSHSACGCESMDASGSSQACAVTGGVEGCGGAPEEVQGISGGLLSAAVLGAVCDWGGGGAGSTMAEETAVRTLCRSSQPDDERGERAVADECSTSGHSPLDTRWEEVLASVGPDSSTVRGAGSAHSGAVEVDIYIVDFYEDSLNISDELDRERYFR